jgi:GT2 family glycosyltransferase
VVVPVFNQVHLTKQLLNVLCEFTPVQELVVVDNGSTDGTQEYLNEIKKRYADTTLIVSPKFDKNRGFVAAVNLGLRICSGDIIIILSNDVQIITLDWLDQIKVALERTPKSLVGAMLITNNPWVLLESGEYIPYMSGHILAFNRQFLTDVGYLDENLVTYFEDVALSVDAMNAGYELVELPDLGLYHHGGGTGATLVDPMRLCLQSKVKFARKRGYKFAHHWADDQWPSEWEAW